MIQRGQTKTIITVRATPGIFWGQTSPLRKEVEDGLLSQPQIMDTKLYGGCQ